MRILRVFGLLVLLAALACGYLFYRIETPYQGFQDPVYVDLPHGMTTDAIAAMLVKAGVARSRFDFLLARMTHRGPVLQAGEYRFDRAASPRDVLDRIARGDIFFLPLVVPEGRNMFEIGADIERLGLFPAAQFVAAARNPEMIRDLDPEAPTLEGYLFPDTYRLNRRSTPESVCHLMTAKFREAWRNIQSGNVHRSVTLASLVEKEAKVPEDRPRIAAVFENRLRIGMKLDCDPTTIYAAMLDHHYRGTIYRSDLESENPYNTYRHAGLPPGPIASPGMASIHAVLHPAETEALYFVLRPDGSGLHQFSNTREAHMTAAEKYHRGLKKVR
ncbi:MAG: endolytic transglycosylase MltG [Candidatus Sulfopaludibacter sp.]|nr:endolytic transglycosylase MltG [Candidatus Sulfopaludibacter sp.]